MIAASCDTYTIDLIDLYKGITGIVGQQSPASNSVHLTVGGPTAYHRGLPWAHFVEGVAELVMAITQPGEAL